MRLLCSITTCLICKACQPSEACHVQVSDVYNQPEIVLVTFPKEIVTAPPGMDLLPNQTDIYLQYMAHLETVLARNQDLKPHFLRLNADGVEVDDFCVSHPNVAAHEHYAEQVVSFLQNELPDWVQGTYSTA